MVDSVLCLSAGLLYQTYNINVKGLQLNVCSLSTVFACSRLERRIFSNYSAANTRRLDCLISSDHNRIVFYSFYIWSPKRFVEFLHQVDEINTNSKASSGSRQLVRSPSFASVRGTSSQFALY